MSLKMPNPGAAVEEMIHGIMVLDPYRWLEDRTSSQTENWIAAQQERCENYFSRCKGMEAIRDRVRKYLEVEVLDQATRTETHCFYRRRNSYQEQACIYAKENGASSERLLIDPSGYGPFASVGIHRISDDGSLLAYELKQGGTDTYAIHFVDVGSGAQLRDNLPTGFSRGLAFAPDKDGYYYCHDTPELSGDHEIRFHRLGDPAELDETIFLCQRRSKSRLLLLSDTCSLGALLCYEDGARSFFDLHLAPRFLDRQWRPILKGLSPPYSPFLHHGKLFAVTNDTRPCNSVIELDEDGHFLRQIVPEWTTDIRQISIANDTIYARYLLNDRSVIRSWSFEGQYAGPVSLPSDGSVQLFASYSYGPKSLFFRWESFTDPPRVFEYVRNTEPSTFGQFSASLSTSQVFRVEESCYPSQDGTTIPISLVMRRADKSQQGSPVIVTAYGGFGVPVTPQFSVLASILVEFGAIFALPQIRGGSEFGTAWHEAARGRHRQVAIDDFIGAASWLRKQKLTRPGKLAIFGGSNSGLLVGAAMVQQPQLFRAVLCIAPVLDMVRYEKLDENRHWKQEYGTVQDPEDFLALHAYSPYHNLKEDQSYPSVFFVSGDKDERCNPAHARKMTARLQGQRMQTNPVLLDYSQERGHSPTLPLSVRIDSLTQRIAFLCKELGIEVFDEVRQ
jgi:prolyl oligopeptidase